MANTLNDNPSIDNTLSIGEVFLIIRRWISLMLSLWWKIMLFGIFGGAIGFFYAYIKPITYTSYLSFNVEEGRSSMGGLASLAGQFGLDVGSNSNSLLTGDNILLYLKSNMLVRSALLTPIDSTSHLSLADRYAECYDLKEKWKKNKKIAIDVNFPFPRVEYSRLQDSLLTSIITTILTKELIVERPEKKATFITVQTTMRDELLSKLFSERLVNDATNRYINYKTKRQRTNVEKLQRRADSIGALLNTKTLSTAIENERILDINPAYRSVTVAAEVTGRDKFMLATVYGEVVKNLEISKMQLAQEMPTIQLIDEPILPLKKNKTSKLLYLLAGGILSGIAFLAYATLKNVAFLTEKGMT